MDFRYSPDEEEVHRYARESFRGHLPLSRLRNPDAMAPAWAAVARDGWLHACLPEPGQAADLPLLVGLAREAGAVAAGEEFVQNGWLIPRLCATIEDGPTREEWLAGHLTTPGWLAEQHGGVALGAHPGFDRYTSDSTTLHRLRPTELTIDAVAGLSVGSGRASVTGGTEHTATLWMSETDIALSAAGARLMRAAALIGLAAEILDRTVTYVSEREQFGQPIGRFQAVKHLCADVYADLQVGWLTVLYAAVNWAVDPFALDEATNQAAHAALGAARTGSQLHGGMGFTWESDLHWLLKAVLDAQLGAATAGAAATRIGAAILETT